MKSNSYKNNNQSLNKSNIYEKSNLKEIISPIVLEVIGKKYTDIYIKYLDKKYYELIEDILKRKKISSLSNLNSKLYNVNKVETKNKSKNNNCEPLYWKDYNFVNNTLIDKEIKNEKNKDKFKYRNIVEISNNNQSIYEEESESIVIKDKEDNNNFTEEINKLSDF